MLTRLLSTTVIKNIKVYRACYSSFTNLKEEKVRVGDWNINYLKAGNGPHHVLCMPGALGSIWTDFKPQIEGFDKENFTLVAWDPPGYGKSRPPNKEFTLRFYEDDADYGVKFMKALNINNFSIMGWSDGGISGLIMAAKYPDIIKKLVVWGANSFILPHELEMYKKILDVNTWSKTMRENMFAVYGETEFPKYWAAWTEGLIAIYNANDGDICRERLKDITCPTLILHGEKDVMADVVHVTHLHTNISKSRIYLYPEGKHNIHMKYAEDFNKRVKEFLMQSDN